MSYSELPLDPYLPADQQDIDDLPEDGWSEEAISQVQQEERSDDD